MSSDMQLKDAKQALAEDKFDDCMSCRVTGMYMFHNSGPVSLALVTDILAQDLPHLLVSVSTATILEWPISGNKRRPLCKAPRNTRWDHASWELPRSLRLWWEWGCGGLSTEHCATKRDRGLWHTVGKNGVFDREE